MMISMQAAAAIGDRRPDLKTRLIQKAERSYFRPTCNVKQSMLRFHLRLLVPYLLLAAVLTGLPLEWAAAQDAPMQISWEVRNRFRLFREERDFQLQVDSDRAGSILDSEDALELQSDGRGWARNTVNRLCIDLAGRIMEPCTRDNVKESYLSPLDHPVTVRLTGQIPVGAICAWSFDVGDGPPQQSTLDCAEDVNLRVAYGRTTGVTVDVGSGSEAAQRLTTTIEVRDVLVAGLGDRVCSGSGHSA